MSPDDHSGRVKFYFLEFCIENLLQLVYKFTYLMPLWHMEWVLNSHKAKNTEKNLKYTIRQHIFYFLGKG